MSEQCLRLRRGQAHHHSVALAVRESLKEVIVVDVVALTSVIVVVESSRIELSRARYSGDSETLEFELFFTDFAPTRTSVQIREKAAK